jgi:hypothetical protein
LKNLDLYRVPNAGVAGGRRKGLAKNVTELHNITVFGDHFDAFFRCNG